ncbi:hypothetical protein U1Q18_009691 [Sarracenia purpurea var. burkii]
MASPESAEDGILPIVVVVGARAAEEGSTCVKCPEVAAALSDGPVTGIGTCEFCGTLDVGDGTCGTPDVSDET